MKKLYLIFVIGIFFSGCLALLDNISSRDLNEIKKSGKLRAITAYGFNSYFLYRGTPLGFEYELLTELAKDLNVELELKIIRRRDILPYMLQSGEGDLIAAHSAVNTEIMKSFVFTDHFLTTSQVLIQRKNEMTTLKSPVDLIGKKVNIIKSDRYRNRLDQLMQEMAGKISVFELPGNLIDEDSIRMVMEKKINYTIADELNAKVSSFYFPDLDYSITLSMPQRIAWILRPQAKELRKFLNQWLANKIKRGFIQQLYIKYYEPGRIMHREAIYYKIIGKGLSPYDKLIKENAKIIKWDWRLLAAMIHQESGFDPLARSWAGARGLMQLMPATAKNMGVKEPTDPSDNIAGGIKFLQWIEGYWSKTIPDSIERVHFILAAYNAGTAHIEDARRLAAEAKLDPNRWFGNVDKFVLNLERPEFYNLPQVKYGYMRGSETYHYVEIIMDRFGQYKKLLPDK